MANGLYMTFCVQNSMFLSCTYLCCNSNLKTILCNNVKTQTIKTTAPPQLLHSSSTAATETGYRVFKIGIEYFKHSQLIDNIKSTYLASSIYLHAICIDWNLKQHSNIAQSYLLQERKPIVDVYAGFVEWKGDTKMG